MNRAEADSASRACGYRNLTRLLLRSDGLLERAEVALRHTLAANPNDVAALLRLGDVQRGKGRFDAALECYRRAASLRPQDPKPNWLVAILTGQDTPAPAPAHGAAPFVRLADFLPRRRCRQLLALALANREAFAPSIPTISTPAGQVDAAVRKGLVLPQQTTDREVRPWFEPPLRRAFAAAGRKLGRREPRDYRIEMEMSAFLGGGYLARHDDNRYRDRRLSFAYYFHRLPRPFAGGELLLHDADDNAFTRIEPQHNSIVFFPPESVHEIAAVEGDPEDFAAARFTLQGWLSSAPAAG